MKDRVAYHTRSILVFYPWTSRVKSKFRFCNFCVHTFLFFGFVQKRNHVAEVHSEEFCLLWRKYLISVIFFFKSTVLHTTSIMNNRNKQNERRILATRFITTNKAKTHFVIITFNDKIAKMSCSMSKRSISILYNNFNNLSYLYSHCCCAYKLACLSSNWLRIMCGVLKNVRRRVCKVRGVLSYTIMWFVEK